MAQLVRSLLPRTRVSNGIFVLIAGTGSAQLIVIASSPILTRLYAPSDYGVFAVVTSILSVLITVTCLRYEFAIPLPRDDVAAANVVTLAILTSLGMSLACAIGLWIAGPVLLATLHASILRPYILLLAIGQFGGGVVSAFTLWAVRTKAFSDIAVTRLIQSAALVAVQVALGVVGFGAPGLMFGDIAGRVSGSSRLARAAWRSHSDAFRRVSRDGILSAARRYRRFPILSGPSSILSTLGQQGPVLLLVILYGPGVGGQFALADRLSSIPLALAAAAVAQVFVAESASMAREEPTKLRALFAQTTKSLARLAAGPAALLAVGAPIFASTVFGDEWAEAGVFVAILAPMYYLTFVATATGDILSVLERQDLQLMREIFRFLLLGGAIVFASAIDLPPIGAVAALSVAGCVTYCIYAAISWRALDTYHSRPRGAGMTDPEPIAETLEATEL
jgi:O-antigen/teichoic acid export membrane protein